MKVGKARKIILYFLVPLLVVYAVIHLSENEHIFRTIQFTYLSGQTGPGIEDCRKFENRHVKHNKSVPFLIEKKEIEIASELMSRIESYDPAALVVIKNGKIVLEKYWDHFSDTSRLNSFSVAKSIVGICILKAIHEGMIEGLNQKVIDFIPELKGKFREQLTIYHLLSMTSGINFDESYGNPFGFMAKAYYGQDLTGTTLNFEAETEPGNVWKYLGGNTILLSFIVSRASKMNLSDFVSKYFLSEMGAVSDALWSLDVEGGVEKAYCCYYTSARDFARFGLLILGNGKLFGNTIMDSALLDEIHKPAVLNNGQSVQHYSLHWWLVEHEGLKATYARGILGQYIITIPSLDMVIVRLGKKRGEKDAFEHPVDLYDYLDLARSVNDQILIPELNRSITPSSSRWFLLLNLLSQF